MDLNANTCILNSAKDTLELFYEEKVKGIIIHVQACWHEHLLEKYQILPKSSKEKSY